MKRVFFLSLILLACLSGMGLSLWSPGVQAQVTSLTGGFPKGSFGSGGQTDGVTEPGNWRWSEWFYGHRGIDRIAWRDDGCGARHNYAIGWHQDDLVEYLMKFGGDSSRLVLRGIADRDGEVELEVYIDGEYRSRAVWNNRDDCNQDTAVEIPNIPYGTHAIAVKFVSDYYNPARGEDVNFYLDGLKVESSSGPPPSPPAVTPSDLFGLHINANYAEQNPSAGELADLGVKWVRSLRYQDGFTPDQRNVKWLVIFNQETIPRNRGESWNAYVRRFSTTVKNIVQNNSWISAVEIWNEQDLADGQHDPGYGRYLTPEDYAVLLKATYQRVKESSNPPIVVSGGLASGPVGAANYLNRVRQVNGGTYFDAAGFHPYLHKVNGVGWYDPMDQAINTFYGATGGRPIWATEFGAAKQHLGNDPNKQADYLKGAYEIFQRLKDGDKRKVQVAFWFTWDDRTHANWEKESFGLVDMNRSGDPDSWRRPAWWAYYDLTHDGSSPGPEPGPGPAPGHTNKLHGTVVDGNGNPESDIFVSIWRHDNQQFLTTYTDGRGVYAFTGLDPDQLYNVVVNARFDPDHGDCGPWRRVDPGRNSAVRNNVELIDGGDGWHGEDFWLTSPCPE